MDKNTEINNEISKEKVFQESNDIEFVAKRETKGETPEVVVEVPEEQLGRTSSSSTPKTKTQPKQDNEDSSSVETLSLSIGYPEEIASSIIAEYKQEISASESESWIIEKILKQLKLKQTA